MKELKAEPLEPLSELVHCAVESGEGIESNVIRARILEHRSDVESGEGIESPFNQLSIFTALIAWNPVKELKDDGFGE